jgi:hypothetical protein
VELLGVAERTVTATLRASMKQNLPREEIKTNVRSKLDLFTQLRETDA